MAGRQNLHRSYGLDQSQVIDRLSYLDPRVVRRGVSYHDAQFDDAYMAIALAKELWQRGVVAVNYAAVEQVLTNDQGEVVGAQVSDRLSNNSAVIEASVVVNATGVAADHLRRQVDETGSPRLRFSQGTHIVVDQPTSVSHAMLVPKTPDGRVIFLVPWHGRLLIGTTDVEREKAELRPNPTPQEIDYLLELANRYLKQPLARNDVKSAFAGQRALVLQRGGKTHQLSRSHQIEVGPPGMINLLGGKWTTFALIASEAADQVMTSLGKCRNMRRPEEGPADVVDAIQGARQVKPHDGEDPIEKAKVSLEVGEAIEPLSALFPLTAHDVRRAVTQEMAMTVEDVLARRHRILFLDAAEAERLAHPVATLMRDAMGKNDDWRDSQVSAFVTLAQQYQCPPNLPSDVRHARP